MSDITKNKSQTSSFFQESSQVVDLVILLIAYFSWVLSKKVELTFFGYNALDTLSTVAFITILIQKVFTKEILSKINMPLLLILGIANIFLLDYFDIHNILGIAILTTLVIKKYQKR